MFVPIVYESLGDYQVWLQQEIDRQEELAHGSDRDAALCADRVLEQCRAAKETLLCR